jgi:hypothetical protein
VNASTSRPSADVQPALGHDEFRIVPLFYREDQ